MAWVLDLDGVIWLSHSAIPGASEAVARLRHAGERVVFVTNNSSARLAEVEGALAAIDIPAVGDVITSAQAAAHMLEPGTSALVCGGPGAVEALVGRGVEVRSAGPVDAVIVGFTRDFDYERLRLAVEAVRGGAHLVATNDDPTFPTPDGPIPGGGALVAAVATAAGTAAVVAGKPYPPMAALARAVLPDGPLVVVGDRPSTDGLFARELGARFVLVLTGVVTAADLPVEPEPDVVAPDLLTAVKEDLTARELR